MTWVFTNLSLSLSLYIYTHTSAIQTIYFKKIIFLIKVTRNLLFLVEYFTIKTDIIRYYLLPSSTHTHTQARQVHKNATSYIEQILEAKLDETAAVRPLTSYL